MNTSDIKSQIDANAKEITRLHKRIHETLLDRNKGEAGLKQWQEACAEFHISYDMLAFPGGYAQALERFKDGDISVIEPALCFLEIRPYFFRSGYMWQVLLRRVKRAALSPSQRQRLDAVLERRDEWRARKGR